MKKRKINKIIVHWSASPATTTVADIDRWHREAGYRGIGYHRVILHPDSVQQLKSLTWSDLTKKGRAINDDTWLEDWEKGAHTLFQNHDSIGLCVVGSPKYGLHELQREALIKSLNILRRRHFLVAAQVGTHRDYNATDCPGEEIYKAIQEYKRLAK